MGEIKTISQENPSHNPSQPRFTHPPMSGILNSHSASARITRAIGLFSGVRIVGIICSLIRNKAIAWFIGPAGMGLVVLLNSIVDLISQSTRLSIDQSAQRDISQTSESNAVVTITVVRRWTIWLGLAGMAVTCALSPLLSLWTFETIERWPVFCILSVVPLCVTYSNCTIAQNQGLRRIRAVALSNVVGAVTGLLVAVPLVVWLRIDSIVWIILAYGVSSWLGAYIFRPRIKSITLPRTEVVEKGRSFIKLGVQITAAVFISQAFAYLFVLFLNTYASTYTLGLYQSGYTLMNSYVGIIFSAMVLEYYPRLSAQANGRRRLQLTASNQLNITLYILTPLLCVLIVLINPVIRVIYSEEFLPIIPYVVLCCSGVIFRAVSWCMAYVILAKGDGKAYLTTEISSSVIGFGCNIAGYLLGGVVGLGIAYVAWFAAYTFIVCAICKRRYDITFLPRTIVISAASFLLTAAFSLIYLLLY